MVNQTLNHKNPYDHFVQLISLCISSLCCFVEAVLYSVFKPENFDLSEYKGIILPSCLKECRPEPYELFIYAIILITFPTVFFFLKEFLIILFSRHKIQNIEKKTNIVELIFIGILFLVFPVALYALYINTCFSSLKFIVLFVVCLIIFVLFDWFFCKKIYYSNKRFQSMLFIFVSSFVVLLLAFRIANMNFLFTQSYINTHHYYAVWYPIYKVFSGQTIGVDFDCIYGFYSYLIVPVLKLFGQVNQHSASIFFSIIISVNAISYYAFCYRFIENKALALFCGTIATFMGPYKLFCGSVYFQCFPLRSLFISLILLIISIYNKFKINKFFLEILTEIILILSLIWNFETGILACLIWVGYLVYISFYNYGINHKNTLKVLIKSVLYVAIAIIASVASIELITYLRSGQFINSNHLLFGIKAFEGTGFYMIPIKPDIWIIFVFIIALGLYFSISDIKLSKIKSNKTNLDKNSALFAVSITAAGSLSYFMGRSLLPCSYVCIPYCTMIFTILYEKLFYQVTGFDLSNKIKKFLVILKKILCCFFIATILLIGFREYSSGIMYSAYSLIPSFRKIETIKNYSENYKKFICTDDDKQSDVYQSFIQIKLWSEKYNNGNSPKIMTEFSVYINELFDEKATDQKCECLDCFYYENVKTYIDFFKNNPNEIYVFDEKIINCISECYNKEFDEYISDYNLVEKTTDLENNLYLYIHK